MTVFGLKNIYFVTSKHVCSIIIAKGIAISRYFSNFVFSWVPFNRDRAKSKLKECVFSCLSECDQYGLKSVAIPAISCGVFGGRASECVQIIVEAIQRYFENQDSSVKKVSITSIVVS